MITTDSHASLPILASSVSLCGQPNKESGWGEVEQEKLEDVHLCSVMEEDTYQCHHFKQGDWGYCR